MERDAQHWRKSVTTQSAPPQMSPDGRWWWNGAEWVPVQQPAWPPAASTVLPRAEGHGNVPLVPVTGRPATTRTDPLAVTSLVAGIVCLGGLGSIVAIVTGHMSRARSKRLGLRPQGLALAGLVLGYIGIALIPVLLAIALPTFLAQKEKAEAAQVKSAIWNAMVAEENYGVTMSSYSTSLADIGYVPEPHVDVAILRASSTDYCIRGQRVGSGQTFYATPLEGLTSTPCG